METWRFVHKDCFAVIDAGRTPRAVERPRYISDIANWTCGSLQHMWNGLTCLCGALRRHPGQRTETSETK